MECDSVLMDSPCKKTFTMLGNNWWLLIRAVYRNFAKGGRIWGMKKEGGGS